MQTLQFTNWTSEDFSHTWNSEPYSFKSGSSQLLPEYLARHFAKHLIDRELTKKGFMTNDMKARADMELLCFGEAVKPVEMTEEKATIQLLNDENIEPAKVPQVPEARFCEACDSKGVRHKKDCPKVKKEEEVFEGLK